MNLNKIIILFLITNFVYAAEVSMFDAGNININKPYGLNKNEKVAYNNQKEIKKLDLKFKNLKSSYNSLNEKIEGISSVYENDSESLHKAKRTISSLNNNFESTNTNIDKLKQITISNTESLISLEKRLDKFISLQEQNNNKISKLLNKINSTYINNNKFDELVNFVNKKSKKKTKNKPKKKSKKVKKLTNAQKLKKIKQMISIRYYTKSLPMIDELLKVNYKPAEVNFYMGEAWYGKHKHENAIHYYKTSMMLYDEAKYIPTLLLHSAISFEKLKDRENAINFYSTLVDTYPSTSQAIKAQQKLNKLK